MVRHCLAELSTLKTYRHHTPHLAMDPIPDDQTLNTDHATSSLLATLSAFFAWTTLYFTLCLLNPRRSYEWHCRTVTLVHALLVVVMSAWAGFRQGPWPFTDPAGPNTPLQRWTCIICLGYFIFDLSWCLYFQTEGALMLIHHALSIFGNVLVLYRGTNGTEMIATIFGSELTNPLLQARWFLRESNQHKTWYYEVNDALFIGLFGFLRIGIASKLLYSYLEHPKPDTVTRVGAVAIYVVGWVFWLFIVRYAFRRYVRMLFGGTKRDKVEQNGTCNGHLSNGVANKKKD